MALVLIRCQSHTRTTPTNFIHLLNKFANWQHSRTARRWRRQRRASDKNKMRKKSNYRRWKAIPHLWVNKELCLARVMHRNNYPVTNCQSVVLRMDTITSHHIAHSFARQTHGVSLCIHNSFTHIFLSLSLPRFRIQFAWMLWNKSRILSYSRRTHITGVMNERKRQHYRNECARLDEFINAVVSHSIRFARRQISMALTRTPRQARHSSIKNTQNQCQYTFTHLHTETNVN